MICQLGYMDGLQYDKHHVLRLEAALNLLFLFRTFQQKDGQKKQL